MCSFFAVLYCGSKTLLLAPVRSPFRPFSSGRFFALLFLLLVCACACAMKLGVG